MSTSSPKRIRQKGELACQPHRAGTPPRRSIAALAFALVAGATAPAAAAPTTPSAAATAPVFDAEYLDGVSGAEPAEEVNLAGTWDFTPLTNTTCTGGGPFGTTTGPFLSCVGLRLPRWADHDPGARRRLGQAGLDRPSVAATAARITRARHRRSPGHQARASAPINHRATLWVDGQRSAPRSTSYTTRCSTSATSSSPGARTASSAGRGAQGPGRAPTAATPSPRAHRGPTTSPRASSGPPTSQVFPAVHISDTFVRPRSPTARSATTSADQRHRSAPQEVELTGAAELLERRELEVPRRSDPSRSWSRPTPPPRHHRRPRALARRHGVVLVARTSLPRRLPARCTTSTSASSDRSAGHARPPRTCGSGSASRAGG